MHKVATELCMDPLDVIRKNLVPAGVFPYRAAAGALIDSGDYPKAVKKAIEEGALDELKKRRDEKRAMGKKIWHWLCCNC
jgi:2-furoyl-CoA dehydrogenase large subunit